MMRKFLCLEVLVLVLGSACSDDGGPLNAPRLDAGSLSCVEAQSQALALYQAVFPEIGDAACQVDDDCVLLGANVECAEFSNYQSPVAVHISEEERARALLSEREALCGSTEAGCLDEPLRACNDAGVSPARCINARCTHEPGCI